MAISEVAVQKEHKVYTKNNTIDSVYNGVMWIPEINQKQITNALVSNSDNKIALITVISAFI